MAGIITSLRFQKRTTDRVNVYLDGAYAFALPAVEAAKLRRGQELSEAEIHALRTLDLRAKGFDKAVRYLASRPRSEWEVRQNLRRYRPRSGDTLSDDQIEWIVEKLKERDYLDDWAFARYWVDQRNQFKPMAPRALRYELRRKGVDNKVIDSIVEEKAEPEDAALKAARQKARRWTHLEEEEFRQKLIGFLQRRGFRWTVVQPAVEQVWQECERGELL